MDGNYLIIVYLLLGLAILDLMVGVSNDAVNFLNSAFGSRVATRRTILIIASLGIIAGATLSSGMMEVARKGIFHPEMFTFADIVVVFVTVMLVDVLLLDTFNTFGMPTSTTVSIVFELLGAAVAVALYHVVSEQNNLSEISRYINSDRAILIISGIGLSIVIAFIVGAVVQFLSRLLFTFKAGHKSGLTTLLWSAFAVTVICFFILLKGLKGAAFLSKETINSITGSPLPIALAVFIASLAIGAFMQYKLRWNLLKIVVLIGTFSLALAFASNDLVNFVGVPLAGLQSYQSWAGSGVEPGVFNMAALAEPIRGQSGLLIIAGIIMVATLWLSEKARSVTETEVNLGRQDEGVERFEPHPISRMIVRLFIYLSKTIAWLFPRRTTIWVEQRYARPEGHPEAGNEPAFDLVRASINLTVASILIAIATTMKLPLSTTYVTFMVAMGTSLADRAWGRDSAVYRVAGVVNVIGGWFATAAVAFTMAAIYALLIKSFGIIALIALMMIAILAMVHTHRLHKDRRSTQLMVDQVDLWNLKASIEQVYHVINSAVMSLAKNDRTAFDATKKRTKKLWRHLQRLEIQLVKHLSQSPAQGLSATRSRLKLFSLEQDLYQSAHLIFKSCKDYVSNAHTPLHEAQRIKLEALMENFANYVNFTLGAKDSHVNTSEATRFATVVEAALQDQVDGLRDGHYSQRNSRLLLSIYLELQDVLSALEKMQRMGSAISATPTAQQDEASVQADSDGDKHSPAPSGALEQPAPEQTKDAKPLGPATT